MMCASAQVSMVQPISMIAAARRAPEPAVSSGRCEASGCCRSMTTRFTVITVLTRESLRQPRRLFDFYVANRIDRVAFNVEEIEGIHATSSLSGDAAGHEVREFYQTFMALTEAHGAKIEVREFVGAFDAIANPESVKYGNPLAEPLRTLSIGADGEI